MAGLTATYVDPDTFTVVGDLTTTFVVGRRVKCNCGVDGYKFGTITSRSFGGGVTTVNLSSGSDNLTSNLTEAWYGIVGGGDTDQSIPIHSHDGSEGSGGEVVSPILQIDRVNITNTLITTSVISEAVSATSGSGVAFGSNAITLLESDSTVRVQMLIPYANDNDAGRGIAVVSRSTTVLAVAAFLGKKEGLAAISIDFYDTPGSVGPHTYAVRVGVSTNTGYFNRSKLQFAPYGLPYVRNNCWLTLTEIAA